MLLAAITDQKMASVLALSRSGILEAEIDEQGQISDDILRITDATEEGGTEDTTDNG